MKIYSKYIIRNLFGPIVFVALTLTGVIWLVQALKYIGLIVNQGLPALTFLSLIILLLPSVTGLVLPIAALCATIFIYNRLTYDSEILVLKAAGISRFGAAKPALMLLLLLVAVGYSVTLYLQPLTFRHFKKEQVELRDNYAAMLLEEGVFNTPLTGIAVYVGEREDNGTLKGILVHDNRVEDKPVTWMAKSGKIVKAGNSVRFLLEDASSQQINRSNGEVRILYFDSYPFDISLYAGNPISRTPKRDERYLGELLYPENSISDKDRHRFFAEAHERLIWPLYTLVLPLVAIGIMLSGDFNRRGQAKRIITVITIATAIILSGFATKNIVSGGKPELVFIMYLPVLLGLIFGLYCLLSSRRVQFTRKPRLQEAV